MSAPAFHRLVARARRLFAAVAACSALAVACQAGTASAANPQVVSAMNGHPLFVSPSADWAPAMAMMASAGVTTVRSDAPWASAQPQPSTSDDPPYDFSSLDAWVTQLAEHNLTWLPIIDATPGWAKSCQGQCPPYNLQWYANFAKAVAARYGDDGSFWAANPSLPHYPAKFFEIWNEENGTEFWSTGPNPAQYAVMYSDARSAIRSVDPQAQVLVGGLGTGDASWFVATMFASTPTLYGNVDGFGLHPYEATATGDEQDVIQFRQTLDALGEGSVPIDLTEFGWTDQGSSHESWRAQMMGQMAVALSHSSCNVQVLAPYAWDNDSSNAPDYSLTDGGSMLPSGSAWFSGLHAAATATATTLCGPGSPPPVSGPTGTPAPTGSSPASGSSSSPASSTGSGSTSGPAKRVTAAKVKMRCLKVKTKTKAKFKTVRTKHGRLRRVRVRVRAKVTTNVVCRPIKPKPKHKTKKSKHAKKSRHGHRARTSTAGNRQRRK